MFNIKNLVQNYLDSNEERYTIAFTIAMLVDSLSNIDHDQYSL